MDNKVRMGVGSMDYNHRDRMEVDNMGHRAVDNMDCKDYTRMDHMDASIKGHVRTGYMDHMDHMDHMVDRMDCMAVVGNNKDRHIAWVQDMDKDYKDPPNLVRKHIFR